MFREVRSSMLAGLFISAAFGLFPVSLSFASGECIDGLWRAVRKGDVERCRSLLISNPHLDGAQKVSLLHLAASGGN